MRCERSDYLDGRFQEISSSRYLPFFPASISLCWSLSSALFWSFSLCCSIPLAPLLSSALFLSVLLLLSFALSCLFSRPPFASVSVLFVLLGPCPLLCSAPSLFVSKSLIGARARAAHQQQATRNKQQTATNDQQRQRQPPQQPKHQQQQQQQEQKIKRNSIEIKLCSPALPGGVITPCIYIYINN